MTGWLPRAEPFNAHGVALNRYRILSIVQLVARPAGICLLLLLFGIGRARAGDAWNRDDGGYYLELGFSSMTADQQFDFGGHQRGLLGDSSGFRDAQIGVSSLRIYCEYGITGWLTAVVNTQYHVAVRRAVLIATGLDATASASGLGDVWVGGEFRLIPGNGPVVASLTASWKIPSGSPHQDIPLGSGSADYEVSGAVGTGFALGVVTGYGEVTGGYRIRGLASDEITYLAALGINLGRSLILQATVDGIQSGADFAGAATSQDAGGAYPTFSEQTFLRGTLGAIYTTNGGFDLNLGYGRQFLGRNTLASSTLLLGVSWKR